MAELNKVKVWDAPVRVVHWLLLLLVCFQYASYSIGGNWMTYHMWSGYSILALVLFRVIWGFVGSTHARFSDFLYGPRVILSYIGSLSKREAGKFAGHNPLGGLSVILLLLLLLLQAGTGLFTYDDTNNLEGPLAKLLKTGTSEFITTIHRYNFYVLLAVIAAHVAAVLFYLFYKSENLVKPMFTGEKLVLPGQTGGHIAGMGLAAALMALVAVAVYLLVTWK